MAVLDRFVPAVSSWFRETLGEPTPPQDEAWPLILDGKDVVVAAPTGSGKTLAAFLAALDGLAREAEVGTLSDEVRVVYVSPLKALSNDIAKNLLLPLQGVVSRLRDSGLSTADIRVLVRTGDTPQKERIAALKKPPHVLVTTPESLFVLLGSVGGQKLLRTARTLILDEIHAVVGVRRGAHLALSVERLDALCASTGRPLQRIGLSATQRPIEKVARFVTGAKAAAVVVDAGHARAIDLAIEMPESPLQAVMAGEVFGEVVRRMATLVEQHKTTLVFVNTRRMAERLAARLDEQLGEGAVGKGLVCAHHGSMAREKRLEAEERLKGGQLRALVATSSLELGIDVGAVDLVCQMGTTRTIASLLQRVGRAGHHKSLIPKGRIFPLSRDELVEAVALIDAVQSKDLDQLLIPEGGTDVLGQHIIAAVAAAGDEGLQQTELGAVLRRAWPYRDFDDARIEEVVKLAAGGVNTARGRRGSWLYQDTTTGTLRPRKGAGLAALTSGGAIPDMGDYSVIEEPGGLSVGSVNEDFAIESVPGDIFQLGTTSWRILRVERGVLRVSDARGQPPTLPFWLGEAPGRSLELSAHTDVVKNMVEDLMQAGADEGEVAAAFVERFHLLWPAAQQLAQYLCAARVALGTLPTQSRIVVERFEDGLGGTHIVFHSPFGSRINRAWGLSLRKKFCRTFDFELQAAATNDSILLSVGAIGGVELATVPHFVNSKTARDVLVQAILQAPMFGTRFRWNVTRSLTVLRNRAGKRVPPGLLRIAAEDVLVALFPQQAACAENIVGDREVPNDVLVRQTIDDCLHEAMDLDGLMGLLKGLESGTISLTCVERIDPSPLAYEVLAARPYAFLDDVPLEERRVQAVLGRGHASSALDDETVALDPLAVQAVLDEVHPTVESEDEAWDALVVFGALLRSELKTIGGLAMPALVDALIKKGRAFEKAQVVVAVERKALLDDPTHELLLEVLRGRLEVGPPRPLLDHLGDLGIEESLTRGALERLVREGTALEGKFVAAEPLQPTIWSRRLITRVRRRMLERLRQEIDPVSAQDFMRFLFQLHGVVDKRRGRDGLRAVLTHLDGQVAPAAAWETEILPARVAGFDFGDLDALCLQGEVLWRCRPGEKVKSSSTGTLVRQTGLCFVDADTAMWWPGPVPDHGDASSSSLSPAAAAVRDVLAARGPSFFRDLQRWLSLAQGHQLPAQLEASLQELIGLGVVVADGFAAVRALVRPAKEKERLRRAQKNRPTFGAGFDVAGRFSLVPAAAPIADELKAENLARLFLRRHGVVFRRLVERDPVAPPWRDLLLALRRMEVRGEVRGGRFVNGFSGEQFALPEAVSALRAMRRSEKTKERVVLSAADPLNLTGVILPGTRIPALVGHRLLFEDGVVVAVFDHKGTRLLDDALAPQVSEVSALLRKKSRRGLHLPAA